LSKKEIQSGPLSTGIFIALLWLTVLVGVVFPALLIIYIPFLIFVRKGLRPLLEKIGLAKLYGTTVDALEDRRYKKYEEKRRSDIDRKARDKKYRGVRRKNPKLPKNW
jgi:hypothetical protein|tara:strand:- start:99 stop:422 length:324 start_codon:yes stop_codon:yes gene_type:complete